MPRTFAALALALAGALTFEGNVALAEPKADVASTTAPVETSGLPTADAAGEASTPATPDPSSTLPRGTTVLHLGDSFAGALGVPLQEALKAAGLRSALQFKSASYIPEWASPKMGVAALVEQKKPDLVLITLGGNELEMLDPSVRAEPVRRLIAQLGGRPCVWIAPSIPPKNDLMEVVRANLGGCRFFDTRALVPELPRLADKVHPTIPARKVWADLVLRWLAEQRDPGGATPWTLKPEPPGPRAALRP